jgi:hypothetical protein
MSVKIQVPVAFGSDFCSLVQGRDCLYFQLQAPELAMELLSVF